MDIAGIRVPTQSLFPGKVLTFDHRSLGPGKVLSFSNFSEWSWKSPYFLIKSRLMNPFHFFSIASSLYQNSCIAKSDVVSQNLKSKKSPHVCGIFLVYQHCEIHHRCPYNTRFGPGKVLEKSLVLIHQNLWEPCGITTVIPTHVFKVTATHLRIRVLYCFFLDFSSDLTHCGLVSSYAICQYTSGSTSAQVTAPSYYLNQRWHLISKVLWHSSEDFITRQAEDISQ